MATAVPGFLNRDASAANSRKSGDPSGQTGDAPRKQRSRPGEAGSERVGIIDLGSNTARLVIYRYGPEGRYQLVSEIRQRVRLGESLGKTGRLSPRAMRRGEATLKLYAAHARSIGLENVSVIASSAVRDAENGPGFLHDVAHIGLPVRVLTGQDEAELGVLAVANSMNLSDAWIVDLGGGSMQISEMRRRSPVRGESFPLGGVRLTEAFLGKEISRRSDIRRLEGYLADRLRPIVDDIRRDSTEIAAMGGAIRNLTSAVQKDESYPLDLLHGYFLRSEALERVIEDLMRLPPAKRAKMGGIHPDRADIILAGALAYRWLLRSCRRDGLWISGQGIREGALYKSILDPPHLIPDVRSFSVQNVLAGYDQDLRHIEHMRHLCRRLFQELEPLHRLGPSEAELLDAAACLHDIGRMLGYHKHHRHGAYLLSATPLGGFTHREQALIVQLVRHHRNRKSMPGWNSYHALAGPGDKRRLRQLAVMLRLAECLELSQSGRVQDLRAAIRANAVRLLLKTSCKPENEMEMASKQSQIFRRVFDKELVIDQAPS